MMMIDQFDGIMHNDNQGYTYAGQETRRRRQYSIAGASVFAFIVLVVVASSGKKSSSAKQQPTNPPLKNSNNGKFTFTARQPPAGVYDDMVSMKVKEDMSALVGEGGPLSSFEMDLEMDSIKTMKDLGDTKQSVNLHITRMLSHIEIGGVDVDCDSNKSDFKSKLMCAKNNELVGNDLEFIIDQDGEVTPQGGHDGKITDSKIAQNPVEHVTSKLKFLPDHPVKIGEMWQSRVVLGDIGDFVGTTTFQSWVDCGKTRCAVFASTGTAYLDARSATASLNSAVGDSMDNISISKSTMELIIHWDEENGIISYSKTNMDFTINMDNIMGEGQVAIPVTEETIMKCSVKS